LKGQTEAVTDEKPSEENVEEVAAPAAPVEEEDKTLTLEEYMKQKKTIVKNANAKVVASAETEQKEDTVKEEAEEVEDAAEPTSQPLEHGFCGASGELGAAAQTGQS